MNNDILIIGGGISGLTTAAYLAKNNIPVTLIEKNDQVGGLIGSFYKDGFLFDKGIRATENSGSLFPMLRDLNIDLKFLENIVTIKIGDKSVRVIDDNSLTEYSKMLCEIYPNDTNEIKQIIELIDKISQYMEVLYGIDNPLFLDMKNDRDYLVKTVLPWMAKFNKTIKKIEKLNIAVDEYLKKITNNESLIDMIIQHFFKDTPTFFALSYFRLYKDYYYPEGGTKSLIDALENYITSNGGKIIINTEITDVVLKDNIAKSGDKEFHFSKLVWAADLKTLYRVVNVENAKNFNLKKYNDKKNLILNSHGNDSIYSLFVATNLPPTYYKGKCSEHNFYTPILDGLSSMKISAIQLIDKLKNSKSDKKELLTSWLIEFANKTTYEISIPVLRDKTLAPENKSAVIISAVFDYDLTSYLYNENLYEFFKETFNKAIIDTLDTYLYPEFKENITDNFSSSPMTIEKHLNNSDGAITGWSFTGKIPVESRMKKMGKAIDTPFNDIIQTGHWVFSPTGMPTSLIIGKLAADRIIKKYK